jgi:hypothetical protein
MHAVFISATILCCSVLWSTSGLQIELTADVADVQHDFGVYFARVSPLIKDPSLAAPPGDYATGAMVLATFRSLSTAGTYEIYTANTTGNIPLPPKKTENAEDSGMICVFRWTTDNFVQYQGGNCVLLLPVTGLSSVKSITRDDNTGLYYLAMWHEDKVSMYLSSNSGIQWNGPHPTHGLHPFKQGNFDSKDDTNLMWSPIDGLVNLQIFWQKNQKIPFPDNGGNDQRRVIGSMRSSDASGKYWSFTGQTLLPNDSSDPPELQFYRIRPYFVPGTEGQRVFAHCLLYAPGPFIKNSSYGRRPPMCQSANPTWCHGPHMYEALWTKAASTNVSDMSASSWRRPADLTTPFAFNHYLFGQPVMCSAAACGSWKEVFIGGGVVFSLPMHRSVGLFAPANGHFTLKRSFTAGSGDSLFVNANVEWGPKLREYGCDEGCAPYLGVELHDASSGDILAGYSFDDCDTVLDLNSVAIPVTWHGSQSLPSGKSFTVKVMFRAATIYAVYVGGAVTPRW